MQLRIGKVYACADMYYYISDKFSRKGKITYIAQKVYANGALGPRIKLKYKVNAFDLQRNITTTIHVNLPKEQRDKAYYLSVVDRAISCLELLEESKFRDSGLKSKIAEMAHASCYYYNHLKGRYYNLRDFAQHLGFKRYRKLYMWIAKYLKEKYSDEKYNNAIPECADSTLLKIVGEYRKRWKSYIGFNKTLDKILIHDLKAYTKEIRKRGLNYS